MTEKEYRQHPAVSRSELFKISESPEKFKFYKDNPTPPTPALIFGQVFHKLALQPEDFENEFAIVPNVDRRTKEGKQIYSDFLENSDGKTIINSDDYEKAKAMCESLYNNKYASKLLNGDKEKPYFWIDETTGEECKCRLDCETDLSEITAIVDVKSSTDASVQGFMKDAVKYGYDFQSAFYTEGAKINTGKKYIFVFIVVEKEAPYAINIFQADSLFMKRGYDLFREYIGIYHDCKITGEWYGYLHYDNTVANQLKGNLFKGPFHLPRMIMMLHDFDTNGNINKFLS